MKRFDPQPERLQRIGLFGGTFNPVHQGHLQAALDVRRQLNLDLVYFIPSALPPHKSSGKLAAAADRLEMVRLAIDRQPGLGLCTLELEREGPSYSIDTVRLIKHTLSGTRQLFFILGLDAFLEIHTWKAYDRLIEETAMVVMSRPGAGMWSAAIRQQVLDYVHRHISDGYEMEKEGHWLTHPHKQLIYLAAVTPVDISSSVIRARIHRGDTVDGWVAPPVIRYLKEKGLYS